MPLDSRLRGTDVGLILRRFSTAARSVKIVGLRILDQPLNNIEWSQTVLTFTQSPQTYLWLVFLACFSLIGCSEIKSVAPPTGDSQQTTDSPAPEADSEVVPN